MAHHARDASAISRRRWGIVTTREDARRAQDRRLVLGIRWAAAAWGLGYALYRGYYALGGTALLPGTPAPGGTFRAINGAAAVILALAAVLPVAIPPLWSRRRLRPVLLGLCWVVAVGCSPHALVDIVERVPSLSGRLRIDYRGSVWASVDRRTADLQDLFFNEPWFLLGGLAFGVLGWLNLRRGRPRRWWAGSAVVATLLGTAIGLLSATGVVGRSIVG